MSIFDRIVSSNDVELAAKATLQKWLPTYLAEIERQNGRAAGSLPLIRAWTTVNEFHKLPEETLPLLVIVSPGLADNPVKEGNGAYRAAFILGVAVVVSAGGSDPKGATRALAADYSAAVRAALLQHRSLGGFASGLDWMDERKDDIPTEAHRSIASGQNIFRVEVRNVVSAHAGPAEPEPLPDRLEPYDDWPVATDVDFDIVKEELT